MEVDRGSVRGHFPELSINTTRFCTNIQLNDSQCLQLYRIAVTLNLELFPIETRFYHRRLLPISITVESEFFEKSFCWPVFLLKLRINLRQWPPDDTVHPNRFSVRTLPCLLKDTYRGWVVWQPVYF
jgi:hypothetical protein